MLFCELIRSSQTNGNVEQNFVYDELSTRLTYPMRIFKLVDVAGVGLRFEVQRQVAGLLAFLFPKTMLGLTDEELQAHAEKLQQAYATDIREDFVLEVRSFRREYKMELHDCRSVKDRLKLLVSAHTLSYMLELGNACVLFCTSR